MGLRHKTSFFGAIFLLYFLLYSASPLFYSHNKGSRNSPCQNQTSASIANYSVFLLDVLFSQLSDNADDDRPVCCGFLIKNKRAVLRLNSFFDPVVAMGESSPQTVASDLPDHYITFYHDPKGGQAIRQGFDTTHSGLSPPLV